jgi:alkylation response protein AidB-like acyl-CoA dehydrogenase
MDFSLTETQAILQDSAQRLVREQFDFETRQKHLTGEQPNDGALWKMFADLGLLGIGIDEEFGGSGGDFHDLAVVLQAFGGSLVIEPYIPTLVLGAGLLNAAGNEAQKSAVLPQIVAGETKLALAHGEFGARYDLSQIAATATADGDGYQINGQKSVVWGGDQADQLIVSARTSGTAGAREGISLFLVGAETPGLTRRGYSLVDDSGAADVSFENVRVDKAALLGPEGAALPLVEQATDRAIAALCYDAIGAIQVLNELTLDYLKTRNQFGRPIGKFQVLQHRMVDMTIAEDQAKSMALIAADKADHPDAVTRGKAISAAKAELGRSAKIVGQGAIQLHGGIGLTMEYSGSHYFKRLTAFERLFGDSDHHLARFAAL